MVEKDGHREVLTQIPASRLVREVLTQLPASRLVVEALGGKVAGRGRRVAKADRKVAGRGRRVAKADRKAADRRVAKAGRKAVAFRVGFLPVAFQVKASHNPDKDST